MIAHSKPSFGKFAFLAGLFLLGLVFYTNFKVSQAAVPSDFEDSLLTTIQYPTALAFTPDGRLLVTTQIGELWVVTPTTQAKSLAFKFTQGAGGNICVGQGTELGLLGITTDPDFTTNRYIYVYYTGKKNPNGSCSPPNGGNRVSRFVLPDNNVISAASELVLLDNIPAPGGNHNAGDLHFGPDGLLYISAGDGGCKYEPTTSTVDYNMCNAQNPNARRLDMLSGKILRINKDGTVPATNPRASDPNARRCGNPAGLPAGTGPCSEMFVWGLRNPFRFAFKPGTSDFYINDVGQGTWEEINLAGEAVKGADFGWNIREGFCVIGSSTNCGSTPPTMTNPLYAYSHDTGCGSITGGAFVPAGIWPASFEGAYLFSDYGCGQIFKLTLNGSTVVTGSFVTGLGSDSAVAMVFGPHNSSQALYYTSYRNGGEVRRIAYTANLNRQPVADLKANPSAGSLPLPVSFDGTGSSDPDAGDTLSYVWNFGTGAPDITTTTPTTSYTYTIAGVYTASLKVRDNHGLFSSPVKLKIFAGNTAPQVQINTPSASTQFVVGQALTLSGSASDAQDGALADSALSWTVLLHHNSHTHPIVPQTAGNNIGLTAPAPEDLDAAVLSYLEIRLTATDSQGLSTVVTRAVQPQRVNVSFDSSPQGAQLKINGITYTTPQQFVSWVNYTLNVEATNQTGPGGTNLTFQSWSDGLAAAHSIVTPPSLASYVAFFNIDNCQPLVVTKLTDDNTCGTLRYALAQASNSAVITLPTGTINLTGRLDISKPLTLLGSCNSPTTLTAANNDMVLLLNGGAYLRGVILQGNIARPLKVGAGANRFACSKITTGG